MNFVTVDPRNLKVEMASAEQLTDLYERVGLDPMGVDHGCICRLPNNETINIVVGEFGMYKPVDEGKYWSLGPILYEGGAVLYAADEPGETVDLNHSPPVTFYKDAAAVEDAISRNEVQRPFMAVNGHVIWQWPQKRPNL